MASKCFNIMGRSQRSRSVHRDSFEKSFSTVDDHGLGQILHVTAVRFLFLPLSYDYLYPEQVGSEPLCLKFLIREKPAFLKYFDEENVLNVLNLFEADSLFVQLFTLKVTNCTGSCNDCLRHLEILRNLRVQCSAHRVKSPEMFIDIGKPTHRYTYS